MGTLLWILALSDKAPDVAWHQTPRLQAKMYILHSLQISSPTPFFVFSDEDTTAQNSISWESECYGQEQFWPQHHPEFPSLVLHLIHPLWMLVTLS